MSNYPPPTIIAWAGHDAPNCPNNAYVYLVTDKQGNVLFDDRPMIAFAPDMITAYDKTRKNMVERKTNDLKLVDVQLNRSPWENGTKVTNWDRGGYMLWGNYGALIARLV